MNSAANAVNKLISQKQYFHRLMGCARCVQTTWNRWHRRKTSVASDKPIFSLTGILMACPKLVYFFYASQQSKHSPRCKMRILQLMFECGIYSVKALLKLYTVLQRPEHSTREKGGNACPNTCAFFFKHATSSGGCGLSHVSLASQ